MKKYNRPVNQYYLDKSKEKVIESVMNEVTRDSFLERLMNYRTQLVAGLMMAALVLLALLSNNPLTGDQNPPSTVQPITLSESETVKFAEVSYLSGTLIASSFQVNSNQMMFLNTTNETEFEGKFDEYHQYFNTLKVFLEPDYFKNNAQLVESDKEEFGSKMLFEADGVNYTIYMNVDEEELTGLLYVNSKVYDLSGTFEEDDEEFSLELYASSGENYININYDSEFGSETEATYSIESMINGEYTEKEIKVSHEEDEYKVVMENTTSSFELTYEFDNGQYIYKLSYEINDQEGEVLITETINEFGETIYHYNVTEGDISKEIDREKPSFDDEDDEDEEDEEDSIDEDEEDSLDEEDEEDEIDTISPMNQTIEKLIL